MALPAAVMAIPAAVQAGTGIYQAVKGGQMARSMDRPEYEIPQEILDNLTDAQIQALRGLPDAQKSLYLDNVARSQQAALEAMSTRKGGLAGLSNVQQQANDAYRNLLSMDAQQRQANERALQAVRSDVAGYRDKAFQQNQMQPYLDMMQAAEAMKGAGLQNIMGGIKSGAAMGLDYLKYKNFMDSMFPGQTSSPLVDISSEVSEVIGIDNQINKDPSVAYETESVLEKVPMGEARGGVYNAMMPNVGVPFATINPNE